MVYRTRNGRQKSDSNLSANSSKELSEPTRKRKTIKKSSKQVEEEEKECHTLQNLNFEEVIEQEQPIWQEHDDFMNHNGSSTATSVMETPRPNKITTPVFQKKTIEATESQTPIRRIPLEVSDPFGMQEEDDETIDVTGTCENSVFREPKYFERIDSSEKRNQSTSSQVDSMMSSSSSTAENGNTSSKNQLWNPIGFAENNLFDVHRGVPFSRSECEENLEKLVRNPKNSDYYPFLELAADCHGKNEQMKKLSLGMAFVTALSNKANQQLQQMSKKIGNETKKCFIVGRGFDMELARKHEEVVVLPSRRCFKISEIITPHHASNWTSTHFVSHCQSLFRTVLKTVAVHDHFFPGFAAADSSTLGYIPVGKLFYEQLIKYPIAGFGQEYNSKTQTDVTCLARGVLNGLLDRFRKEYTEKMVDSPKAVAKSLAQQLQDYGGSFENDPIIFNDPNPPHVNFLCLK